MNEHATSHALYRKLLRLYPREFRERVGESMEQTFQDLYKERRAENPAFGFILWTFTETGMGIFREHLLLITEGAAMKHMVSNPIFSPVFSFILCVFPFMILEWATRSDAPRSDASPMLWVVLWFLATGFMAVLMLVLRSVRAGNINIMNPVSLLFRLVFLVLFAWFWGALVIDQMPCFLGGSGC